MRRLEVPPLDDARRPIRTGLIAAAVFVGLFFLFALARADLRRRDRRRRGDASPAAGCSSSRKARHRRRDAGPRRRSSCAPASRWCGSTASAPAPACARRRPAATRCARSRRASSPSATAPRVSLFPPDLASRSGDPAAAAAMRAQAALFARRRPMLAADRTIADARLDGGRGAPRGQRDASSRLIEEELADVRCLYRRGFARKTDHARARAHRRPAPRRRRRAAGRRRPRRR